MDKSSKKLKMGHVQDSPVATTRISNECMIYHMKVHIFGYNLGPKKMSKSKIHILTISEPISMKPVSYWIKRYLKTPDFHASYDLIATESKGMLKSPDFHASFDPIATESKGMLKVQIFTHHMTL